MPLQFATSDDHDRRNQVTRPAIDSFVRLVRDFPELGLRRGQLGAVKAVWCEPSGAVEVEFPCGDCGVPARALLLEDAIHVVENAFAPYGRESTLRAGPAAAAFRSDPPRRHLFAWHVRRAAFRM
jgi:hypothetical protein